MEMLLCTLVVGPLPIASTREHSCPFTDMRDGRSLPYSRKMLHDPERYRRGLMQRQQCLERWMPPRWPCKSVRRGRLAADATIITAYRGEGLLAGSHTRPTESTRRVATRCKMQLQSR